MIEMSNTELVERAKNLKMLVLDVDGVLTEGKITLIGENLEAKCFDTHDGLGIVFLKTAGVKVAIITGRVSPMVRRRAAELEIDEVFEGVVFKQKSMEALAEKLEMTTDQLAYVGDDLPDVPALKIVGIPISVANARPEVKDYSVYITTAPGGHGAVREIAEWLLELRGEKQEIFDQCLLTAEEKAAREPAGNETEDLPAYSRSSEKS